MQVINISLLPLKIVPIITYFQPVQENVSKDPIGTWRFRLFPVPALTQAALQRLPRATEFIVKSIVQGGKLFPCPA